MVLLEPANITNDCRSRFLGGSLLNQGTLSQLISEQGTKAWRMASYKDCQSRQRHNRSGNVREKKHGLLKTLSQNR